MITIANVKYTPSEIITMIKKSPETVWFKSYPYYLLKIDGSGNASFATFPDLILRLGSYVMSEPKDDPVKLARYRGTGPEKNSAMILDPVDHTKVKSDDVAAITHLMATGGTGNGITNKSAHMTDPETGHAKGNGITVSEFYVNGADGRRATKRTEGLKITYYYSKSHAYNTYEYARLT